jgi:RNA-directed DNA polymerase
LTTRKKAGQDVGAQVGKINRKLKGWSNYFRIGTVSKAYRNVDSHVRHRVRQWLSVKFKVQGHGRRRFPDQHLYQKLGLYQLQRT